MFLAVTLNDLLFSLVAIAIVFIVLALLVVIVSLMSKIKFKEGKKEAAPAPVAAAPVQKKFSVEDIKDEDMMVAALVATADFIEETKKTDVRVVSVKQIG
jgi:sodium pump decarboxylase gamma subunit